jgi:amphi-Trp domain-containing protein
VRNRFHNRRASSKRPEVAGRGRIEASAGNWTLAVSPREPIKVEVQYKHDPRKRELEFQVKLKENP